MSLKIQKSIARHLHKNAGSRVVGKKQQHKGYGAVIEGLFSQNWFCIFRANIHEMWAVMT